MLAGKYSIFTFSLIAILSALPAYAEIASKGYVDDTRVAATQTNKDYVLTTNKTTGAVETKKFVHSKAANGNNVYSSGATEADKDTSVPSVALVEKIANTAIGDSVALNQGAGNNNRILVTDNSGDVVTGTSTDVTVANGVVSVTHATSADSATSATSATTAGSADSVAWTGVTDKPSTFTPSAHNQASNTINAMTDYSKPNATGAIAAGDTLNQAIGKLEKALDGKQATIAANTYDAYGAASGVQSAIEGKLDDGATGYDIDAKTLKVQGVDVLTSHQDISGKQDASTAVTHTANTAAGSTSIPVYVNANGVATEISQFGTVANNTTAGQGGSLVKGQTVYTEVRPAQTSNGTGYLGAPASTTTATNLTNLDTALKTIHPNTGEVKIPSGSETSSTLASIWVE